MKEPKVLFILHLPPPQYGASIVGNYIKDSEVINEELDADYINLATNRILSQTGKGSIKKIFIFSSLLKQILGALRRKKYDLIYITLTACGVGFYKDLIVISVVRLFTKNIIYHFHNKGVGNPKNNFVNSLYEYVFKDTKSILLSRYLYPDVQKYVAKENVFYCACGIPVIPVNTTDFNQTKYSIEQSEVPCRLLYLSNMLFEKGIFVLLDACEQLKKKNVVFECHFVGGWFDVKEDFFNKKIKDKNLSDVVFAHGPKYNEEKLAWYRKADVFVFPTFYHYETFGLVNLEAMQYELPIVSTPEGGIPDIVVDGETGFLVKQQDATALAKKLQLLIEDPSLRKKMGRAGKKRFNDFFTLEKFERNLTDILKEAVAEKKLESVL